MTATQPDPRVIGPYRVIAGLGAGGMARVYLALSQKPGFDKLFVLKLLREELVADPEFRSMFLNEARVAARLNHPNVIHTYETGIADEQHFIAMEYLEGQALSTIVGRLGRKNVPLPVQLRILCEVLAGLEYAHGLADYDGTPLAIVHRDVSPQNVFVTYPGQVKLVDFGIAKVAGSAALTREGAMKGKLGYMAPEQALSKPLDGRADVFSVGVMLWEALTARRFFKVGEQEVAVLRRRLSGEEEKVTSLAPDAPPELIAICEKAMAHDPDNRYATAASMRDALEAYLRKTTNAGASELAALLEGHFAEERVKMKRLVEEQVKSAPTSAPILMLTATTSSRDTPRQRPSDGGILLEADGAPTETAVPPGSKPWPRALVMAASLVAIGAIVVAALFGWPRRKPAPLPTATLATVDVAQAPPPITPPAPPAPSATTAPSPKDSLVVVAFEVSPANAVVRLDGAPLDPPYQVRRAADAAPHKLEVTARGYAPQARAVSLDRDHTETVSLVRATGWRAPSRPATAAGSTEPDVDLSKEPKSRTKRPIDDQDPY